MDEFVDCILNNKEPQTGTDNTFATHEVIFAADTSAMPYLPAGASS